MKRIGITQRVEQVQSHAERRDCLDQRWVAFVLQLKSIPVPLPNIPPAQVASFLDALSLDAILLSGGNSIASLDSTASDTAPERDAFEVALLDEALSRNIPIVGVCRGMQVINRHFGGKLQKTRGHVAVRHAIMPVDDRYPLPETVNSYHNWGIPREQLADELTPVAVDCDGHVEAFIHAEKNVLGIMWHPEREQPFDPLDIELIKRVLL
jgi:gamma-glutamyl-gamma-aminobutyrate hydrolase PuuD